MIEIVTPGEEHREQVFDVLRTALNLGNAHREERIAWLPISRMRCAVENGRVVATAGARDFRQRFGGTDIGMSGIWGVGTLPEHRGSGLATKAVTALLIDALGTGQPISALFPATIRPYRRLGYELAGTYTKHEIALADLPSVESSLEVVELERERDLEGVRACYRASIREQTGPIDSDEEDWWPDRILGPGWSDDVHRAIVARGTSGTIEAYASFTQSDAPELEFGYDIECKQLVASSREGLESLVAYFRGFRGIGASLRSPGPQTHPLEYLVDDQLVRHVWTFRWMLRLLDVPAAFEQRGYPPVSGETLIAVEDDLFPDNRGPWRIVADEGTVKVEPAEGATVRPTSIGALSSMFSGFLSPFDAVRLGVLEPDAASLLATLFAGPAPWMHDWF
ncbi:MAG TPA: GNAT family N-acetyltransferase [Actinomycetota bacterium]|jgi:predicted acetyltransferase